MTGLLYEKEQNQQHGGQRGTLGVAHILDVDNYPAYEFREGDIWLGRTTQKGFPVGFNDDTHITVVAGSRSGKGTAFIVPNLCVWEGSTVVIDPKGENATLTAARRGSGSDYCEGMGQKVCVLDPFNAAASLAEEYKGCFNPLDILDPDSETLVDDASRIAASLVISNDKGEKFFQDQAKSLIKALIIFVVTHPDLDESCRNLVTVRDFIQRGFWEEYQIRLENGNIDTEEITPFNLMFKEMCDTPHPVVSGTGITFMEMPNKTRSSIFAEASNHTEFLDSPPMQRCVSHSSISLEQLKTDEKGLSLYLTLPQSKTHSHHRWLRMMTDLILLEMERITHLPKNGHPVLMLFDEFAGLERMPEIEKGVAQMAGFGVKMCFILQSLPQLKSVYGDNWETFLSNSGLKLFFGNEDHFTLDYASKLVGNTQVLMRLQNNSLAEAKSYSEAISKSITHSIGSSFSKALGKSIGSSTNKGENRSKNWGESVSATYGKSNPLPLNTTQSKNIGGSIGDSWGTGTSEGNSNTNTHSVNHSTSFGQTTTETKGTTQTTTSGTTESIHKTALLPPEEIRTLFGHDYTLILVKGEQPLIVRRQNYFEDIFFTGLFDPHPNHNPPLLLWGDTCIESPSTETLNTLFKKTPTIRLNIKEGDFICKNELLFTSSPLKEIALSLAEREELDSKFLKSLSPLSGKVTQLFLMDGKPFQADQPICNITYNRRQLWLEESIDYRNNALLLAQRIWKGLEASKTTVENVMTEPAQPVFERLWAETLTLVAIRFLGWACFGLLLFGSFYGQSDSPLLSLGLFPYSAGVLWLGVHGLFRVLFKRPVASGKDVKFKQAAANFLIINLFWIALAFPLHYWISNSSTEKASTTPENPIVEQTSPQDLSEPSPPVEKPLPPTEEELFEERKAAAERRIAEMRLQQEELQAQESLERAKADLEEEKNRNNPVIIENNPFNEGDYVSSPNDTNFDQNSNQ